MKSIKILLPAMLLVSLAGCVSDHPHHSNVKIMTKSNQHIQIKATGYPPQGAKSFKAKGWKN